MATATTRDISLPFKTLQSGTVKKECGGAGEEGRPISSAGNHSNALCLFQFPKPFSSVSRGAQWGTDMKGQLDHLSSSIGMETGMPLVRA